MTSFVDLMGHHVWTEEDITRRTEAIVRAQFSSEAETILQRKVTGQILGQYHLTDDEQAQLAAFSALSLEASAAGDAARTDSALLASTLAYEAATARLALPADSANPDDADQRTAAQAVVSGASADVLALYQSRQAYRDAGAVALADADAAALALRAANAGRSVADQEAFEAQQAAQAAAEAAAVAKAAYDYRALCERAVVNGLSPEDEAALEARALAAGRTLDGQIYFERTGAELPALP